MLEIFRKNCQKKSKSFRFRCYSDLKMWKKSIFLPYIFAKYAKYPLLRHHNQVSNNCFQYYGLNIVFIILSIASVVFPSSQRCWFFNSKQFPFESTKKSESSYCCKNKLLICILILILFIIFIFLQSWIKILLRDFRPVWLTKAIFINGKF